jgi:hypothetical protein
MARLELSLPEEFGPRGDVDRAAAELTGREIDVGTRPDGSGHHSPLIVRWFRTWATGDEVTGRASS